MKGRVLIIIGSILLIAVGIFVFLGGIADTRIENFLIGALFLIFGIMGFFLKNPSTGVFFIIAGIVSLIPAILLLISIAQAQKGGDTAAAVILILLPILVVAILWIIGGVKQRKGRT